MAETTEHEAINRFIEGTRYAADYMLQLQDIDRFPRASAKFLKHLRDASGSAHQLAHMQQNPVFLEIRDQLERLIKQSARMAFQHHIGKKMPGYNGGNMFVQTSDMLKALAILGKKIASSKALKRSEVLGMIDQREIIAKAELNANTGR